MYCKNKYKHIASEHQIHVINMSLQNLCNCIAARYATIQVIQSRITSLLLSQAKDSPVRQDQAAIALQTIDLIHCQKLFRMPYNCIVILSIGFSWEERRNSIANKVPFVYRTTKKKTQLPKTGLQNNKQPNMSFKHFSACKALPAARHPFATSYNSGTLSG